MCLGKRVRSVEEEEEEEEEERRTCNSCNSLWAFLRASDAVRGGNECYF